MGKYIILFTLIASPCFAGITFDMAMHEQKNTVQFNGGQRLYFPFNDGIILISKGRGAIHITQQYGLLDFPRLTDWIDPTDKVTLLYIADPYVMRNLDLIIEHIRKFIGAPILREKAKVKKEGYQFIYVYPSGDYEIKNTVGSSVYAGSELIKKGE